MEKCEDKYANEMEVTNLLTKVRDTFAMVGNLQTKQQKELLKYSKDRVIKVDTSSSSGFFTSSDFSFDSDDEGFAKTQNFREKTEKIHEDISSVLGYSIIKGMKINYT
jgi:hypothetical protein